MQAQQMVADNIGLAVAITATWLCRGSTKLRTALPLLALPFLIAGDLFSIYHELKAIQLRTLNKERAELIADTWLASGRIPTAQEVNPCKCSLCLHLT